METVKNTVLNLVERNITAVFAFKTAVIVIWRRESLSVRYMTELRIRRELRKAPPPYL